ncbi:hypothetical protein RvY_08659 [Ramazzottius varieornatus]|uniref:Carbonic anhydrase n=1 Tax=Ramazzottius varieornatus TaxID=947166 RepID=A0A1D1V8W4_RAMVA|nr:hypothetical protein RvY_08659 [Ramazzottius varieornatus]
MPCSCRSADLLSNGSSRAPSTDEDSLDSSPDSGEKRKTLERKESYNYCECVLEREESVAGPPGFQTRKVRDEKMVFGIDKVLSGIVKYHQTVRGGMLEQFKRVRDNPVPSVLMFTCMDSRMIPSRFTQSDVGEMFIVRNAGVLIPHYKYYGKEATITTEPGALELACVINTVQDIIVCGHSDCKAMNLLQSLKAENTPEDTDFAHSPLRSWLMRYGGDSWVQFEKMLQSKKNRLVFMEGNHAYEAVIDAKNEFNMADKFSQVSTLHQLENITSYPFMQRLVDSGLVRLHAMWFDIYTGSIFYFNKPHKTFIEITEKNWDEFLNEKDREALKKQQIFGLRNLVI